MSRLFCGLQLSLHIWLGLVEVSLQPSRLSLMSLVFSGAKLRWSGNICNDRIAFWVLVAEEATKLLTATWSCWGRKTPGITIPSQFGGQVGA